eukprot:TRINITY_DN77597_c0_g1_i3.p3 TRINITY_DN77597_c0_g1~~TRINITY_DN77597_c0_g1_i3.p3  ORF type:complete len:126 (+),score=1.08 TRINITY_DN77597_c0_g1_i3:111-488(+)
MSANLQQQRLRRQRDCALKGDRYGSCSEAKDATVPEASTQLPRIGSRSLYSEEELHYTLNLLCQRQDRLGGQLSMLHREVQELRVLMTSMLQDQTRWHVVTSQINIFCMIGLEMYILTILHIVPL